MPKLEALSDDGVTLVGYTFQCPGCRLSHGVWVKPHQNEKGASWTFNGDLEAPTFSPSILTRVGFDGDRADLVCHSYVRQGQIEFLSDSTHALAGQAVDMLEVADGD